MTNLIRISLIALLFLTAPVLSAQTGVDVRVEIQLANDTARGGEPFSFTAKITNAGTKDATDVIVLVDDSYNGNARFEITSGIPQKGECELNGERSDRAWRCQLGTLAPGEAVTANFSGRIADFDDHDAVDGPLGETRARLIQMLSKNQALPLAQSSAVERKPDANIAMVSAFPDVSEEDTENNHANVYVHLMPSSNRAPRVAITSPKDDARLTRPAKKTTSFEFKIEASDPDGIIEKVVVQDPKYATLPTPGPYGRWNFVYLGKTYTAEELETFMRSNPPPELLAERIGKNTFVYRLRDPAWGRSSLTAKAYDNGGRVAYSTVNFFVKGDATIEIVSPKKDQIITPGSTVVIETLARVNEGPVKEVFIFNSILVGTRPDDKLPQMELISKQGNVYRHRYLWKNIPANSVSTTVQVGLVEESGATIESEPVHFLPRSLSKINITSITNGQIFTGAKAIEIRFNATDSNSNDRYALYIDGKYRNDVYGGFVWNHPEPGAHTIQVVAKSFEVEVGRSELVTIYVK